MFRLTRQENNRLMEASRKMADEYSARIHDLASEHIARLTAERDAAVRERERLRNAVMDAVITLEYDRTWSVSEIRRIRIMVAARLRAAASGETA